ncbi:hypothetical protein GIY21_00910 [Xanthomonas sontii]|uniref:Uncharacterized protein n=1 Tax=Xanthomonas sontii TaxID=2650745 RepID=A0A6N7Q541_9XANT|nr:hypothetical protein [Xanthomonas sontii]MRG98847.1 hypothetical protein [Xanthomonas sontii]MRH73362.1 hypothetical protein [Xanthomonas sontii]
MKEQPFGRDTVVLLVMAFGFGALFAWGLSTPSGGKAHAVASKPLDWPAWVQAVGSVLAICAAVLIARWQRVSERLDARTKEAREALSLAAVLLEDVKRFRDNLEEAVSTVENRPNTGVFVSLSHMPKHLWERAADLHKLGDAGSQLLRAIFRYHEAQDCADVGILLQENRVEYLEHMRAALGLCDSALEGMRDLSQ